MQRSVSNEVERGLLLLLFYAIVQIAFLYFRKVRPVDGVSVDFLAV